MIIPVILSGGTGSRLWPMSRELNPKQFLALCSEQTMLQETMIRLDGIDDLAAPVVVCNEEHRFLVAQQMRDIGVDVDKIILEPVGRNTAPAICAAAEYIQGRDGSGDDVMLILAADHVIQNKTVFHQVVESGYRVAQQGQLVTFGIVPHKAETGYGYIKRAAIFEQDENAYKVAQFVEKPNLETAQEYFASGEYYWNSGMFMFQASAILQELKAFSSDIYESVKNAVKKGAKDLDFCRLEVDAFIASPSDSIDYAVMEKTDKAVVLPLDADWSDVGAWSALWEVKSHDTQGNVIHGDVLQHDLSNSYIHAEERMIAVIGMDNCVVVETADAVLVADKSRSQDVKEIVNQLKNTRREEILSHQRVYRPWGSYETLEETERFKVKRIVVNPGAKLSLQMHHHRAEHWVVVKGTAKIICGDKEFVMTEDQSNYTPLGTQHRLENPGVIPLEIIEIQTGSYLGEDDIVRFDDHYGRAE
ncbi:MAG: mannose-1-phosphate guanylyltransferase/mannose-6-phosphate isomerase [gamma proteobacterium symbiont of Bathyaustriella thionipta]|nr:mannose-1-phosphate guanylyltransferase/mannose-6-phosphate isomerase [gamma proteobacterium symbiont of Bathyaustriella thionipta]MCU7949211.1 mannose-1-phosphate guanylyltransferase/mannose-6-phosphate isomerase [gamma proteobacterium symbiont of Bathyaustriella thionipta]MCU7954903.1 mannose-1-phosphate guanylyltransferase/mannose-6-phosphate isomerase [gamma proteobacterium symbiont of Bathyaustriella thionipta]MCU7955778.1 mannose-1-phosphate guanylyltransferase/mannose-6-phosphate isome